MRRADLNLPTQELFLWVQKLLLLLPASKRTNRHFDGEAFDRLLPGAGSKAGHFSFLKAMWARLRRSGSAAADAQDTLHLFFVAIERISSHMSDQAKTSLLVWLRDTDQLPRLLNLVGCVPKGDRRRAIDLLTWIFFRHHGATASERISFDVLQRMVSDTEALQRFQALCRSAFARHSDFKRGAELFEKASASETLGRFERLEPDLNKVNTGQTGSKKVAGTGRGAWKFPGKNYEPGKNFIIFDLVVRGPNNRLRFASCADGQMDYLLGKLAIVCNPPAGNFDRAVEELRFLAREVGVADLAPLSGMSQQAARREVALRAVLLVHPDSVLPLRAVVESMDPKKLDKLLGEFMTLRGLEDREKALEDLLASIQPGVDLD